MRAFWIVLDSAGIGNAPDAEAFGDEGSNTWKTCYDSGKLHIPNMEKLGRISKKLPKSARPFSARQIGLCASVQQWQLVCSFLLGCLPT